MAAVRLYMDLVYCEYIVTKQSRKGRKRPALQGSNQVKTKVTQSGLDCIYGSASSYSSSHPHDYPMHCKTAVEISWRRFQTSQRRIEHSRGVTV